MPFKDLLMKKAVKFAEVAVGGHFYPGPQRTAIYHKTGDTSAVLVVNDAQTGLNVGDYIDNWSKNQTVFIAGTPKKSVVITLDDGFKVKNGMIAYVDDGIDAVYWLIMRIRDKLIAQRISESDDLAYHSTISGALGMAWFKGNVVKVYEGFSTANSGNEYLMGIMIGGEPKSKLLWSKF